MNRQKLRGYVCAVSGGIFWGLSGTAGQYLLTEKGLDSQWLTVVRMVLAGLVLLLLAAVKTPRRMGEIWRVKRDAIRLVAFAVIGLMACQYTYFTAIYYSNSGTATVLQYLGQVLILLYTCAAAKRLPVRRELLAVALALSGVFLLITHGNPAELVLSREGIFWGLAAALGLALYTLIPGDLIARYTCPIVVGYGMLIGGIVLLFLTQWWRFEVTLDGMSVFALAVIVLVGTALAFSLYLQGVSDLGGVKASLLACLEPVSAVVFSALLLGTRFVLLDVAAFALIIGMGVVLATPEKGRKPGNTNRDG